MKQTETTNKKQQPTVPSITEEFRKEIKWKQLPTGLYVVYFDGGGEVPQELSGAWTSIQKMQSAIENYKIKRGY